MGGGESSSTKMSPKGQTQDIPKMEVRVSCIATPGAEPQGIRVKIPEPKKRPISPTTCLTITRNNTRCPSMTERDLYKKTQTYDRRERYTTLSGAEIKQLSKLNDDNVANNLGNNNSNSGKNKRNPMLDRKNRYPTISGAELRRGLTIGKCQLEDGLDLSLAPWPGMKWACVRVLHLYCKVFDQIGLFELIVR